MAGGRQPKSTEKHIADGTFKKPRHAARVSLPILEIYPDAPEDFDEQHREKWNWLCNHLHTAGLLTASDLEVMRIYVCASVTETNEYRLIQKEGTVIDLNGKPIRNPHCITWNDAVNQMRHLFVELGLSPSARMRMKVEKPKDDIDPLENLN